MKEILIIKDPKVAKLFACKVRREILHNLKSRELTAADLARILDRSNSSIAHHLRLLKDAGLVEETRREVTRNLIQTFYVTTARNFVVSYSLTDSFSAEAREFMDWSREILKKGLNGLKAFGYDIPEDEIPPILDRLELWVNLKRKAYEESVEQQIAPTGLETPAFGMMMDLLSSLRLAGNPQFKNLTRELENILTRYGLQKREMDKIGES